MKLWKQTFKNRLSYTENRRVNPDDSEVNLVIIHGPELEDSRDCSYFPEKNSRFEFMFAHSLSEAEFDDLLETGWRKFGVYFFRPRCPSCKMCVPIRIPVDTFKQSKSQRRIFRHNSHLTMKLGPLEFHESVYQLYLKHSKRFPDSPYTTRETFVNAFCQPSVPGFLTCFYEEESLVAAGFLDVSERALSSVYFIFDPQFEKQSLGTFGAISELQMAQFLGKEFYYLGYWIEQHPSMNYKARFRPYQLFDWETKQWKAGL